MEKLKKIRKRAAQIFRESWDGGEFPCVDGALRQAAEEFGLPHHGVEGICSKNGSRGFSYLNLGDTYRLTVGAFASSSGAGFTVRSWGDVAEAHPDWC